MGGFCLRGSDAPIPESRLHILKTHQPSRVPCFRSYIVCVWGNLIVQRIAQRVGGSSWDPKLCFTLRGWARPVYSMKSQLRCSLGHAVTPPVARSSCSRKQRLRQSCTCQAQPSQRSERSLGVARSSTVEMADTQGSEAESEVGVCCN